MFSNANSSSSKFSLLTILSRDNLNGSNIHNWYLNLVMVLTKNTKNQAIEVVLHKVPPTNSSRADRNKYDT